MHHWAKIAAAVSLIVSAADVAAEDLPRVMEGLPEHLIYVYTRSNVGPTPQNAQEQLYASTRRWEPGRVLRVCMFGGNTTVASLIKQVAAEWNGVSSVSLDFGPAAGGYNCLSPSVGFFQVRVGFAERGYWSVVGNDSERLLDPLAPSLNLESFSRIYSEARYSPAAVTGAADAYHKAVIRHEFGHALGLLHEHQNPALNCFQQIRWSGPGNVYDYFGESPNNWSQAQVDRNLGFIGTTDPDYVAGAPDPRSIMMYALPAAIFNDGAGSQCAAPVNYDISQKDRAIVARMYPPLPAGGPQIADSSLTSNLRPLPSDIPDQTRTDIRTRVLVDLESNDAYTRRDARARLAALLNSGTSQPELSDLVGRLDAGSYRYKLGLSMALANSTAGDRLTAEDRHKLTNLAQSTTDATLRRHLRAIQ